MAADPQKRRERNPIGLSGRARASGASGCPLEMRRLSACAWMRRRTAQPRVAASRMASPRGPVGRMVEEHRAEDRGFHARQVLHGVNHVVTLGAIALDGEHDETGGLRPDERVPGQVDRRRGDDDDVKVLVELLDEFACRIPGPPMCSSRSLRCRSQPASAGA